MASSDAIVRAHEITRRFPLRGDDVVAIENVDADIARGTLSVIAGPSGSGKSTFLRIAACLDRPTSGSVRLDGTEVQALRNRARRTLRRRMIGLLHAVPAHNLLADLDAGSNLVAAARLRGAMVEVDPRLVAVGLGDRTAARVTDLSSGEQLRLALAIALVGSPPIVVADEPTASLDAETASTIAALIRDLAARGTTFLVASHDPALIDVADAVIRLDHGRRVA